MEIKIISHSKNQVSINQLFSSKYSSGQSRINRHERIKPRVPSWVALILIVRYIFVPEKFRPNDIAARKWNRVNEKCEKKEDKENQVTRRLNISSCISPSFDGIPVKPRIVSVQIQLYTCISVEFTVSVWPVWEKKKLIMKDAGVRE